MSDIVEKTMLQNESGLCISMLPFKKSLLNISCGKMRVAIFPKEATV
jgi:hypothetical protein